MLSKKSYLFSSETFLALFFLKVGKVADGCSIIVFFSSSLNWIFLANGLFTHQFDESEKAFIANSILIVLNRYPSNTNITE